MMLRTLVLVACLSASTAALAQSDAEVCATLAPKVRQLATDAAAFMATALDALPEDLERADPSPETERAAYEMGMSFPEPIAGPVGEYAAALIRLRIPLAAYVEEIERAADATEACAALR